MTLLAEREFKRILLIKPSSMGDVLHALPVLWALRRRYPKARISWLVAGSCAPLIAGHPALDEVIVFERERFSRVGRDRGATGAFVQLLFDLRRRRFDLVVDLQGLFRSGFLAWASGCCNRIGFGNARELGWAFYSHRIPPISGEAHAVDRNMQVGRLLAFDVSRCDMSMPVDPRAHEAVRSKLDAEGLVPGADYLAVAPGARWETKCWPVASFTQVVDHVHQVQGCRSVLLGSPGEVELCASLKSACRSDPINLAGQTSHAELVATIAGARGLLCNDSGTKDIAVALGVPATVIFGPTSPIRTGPYARSRDVIRAGLDCSPCFFRKRDQCPFDLRCLTEVEPRAVCEKVLEPWTTESWYNGARPPGAESTIS